MLTVSRSDTCELNMNDAVYFLRSLTVFFCDERVPGIVSEYVNDSYFTDLSEYVLDVLVHNGFYLNVLCFVFFYIIFFTMIQDTRP